MPRCYECSKVVITNQWPLDEGALRTWSSGPELISSADSGCDLCSFIRKEIEKVSTANLARIHDKPPIVLRNHHKAIVLEKHQIYFCKSDFFSHPLRIALRSSYHWIGIPALEPPCDPVLRAHELLKACMLGEKDEHDLCKPCEVDPSVKASSLPRRLLDLSHSNSILTLDTQDWIARNRATIDELSKYCTLSYRWGRQPPPCMLRTQPTADRIIFEVSMPQTFQDAIAVARELGIRFLWIDALCIIQPSAHGDYTDWNMEGPRMWLVYQNAICTIAATCSDQPSDGFLHKVGIDYNPPCSIPEAGITDRTREPLLMFTGVRTQYASVVASNLNRRGWVTQERLLSRRILHFSEEGVFWECKASGKEVEDAKELDDDEEPDPDKDYVGGENGENIGPHHASFMVLGTWLAFIELYSMSKFTLQVDRLIALSSIARCVPTERFGHEYHAGMWGSQLLSCLSWSSRTPCSVTARESCLTIAPSWSWASVAGGVRYPRRSLGPHSKSLLEIIDVQTSLAEASNQYGNIKKGALKLQAILCNLSLPTDGKLSLRLKGPAFSESIYGYGSLAWDECQNHSTVIEAYSVIPLGIYPEDKLSSYDALYEALVITPLLPTGDEVTGDSCGVYRRIGHIYWQLIEFKCGRVEDPGDVRSKLSVWFDALFPNAKEQTIVII